MKVPIVAWFLYGPLKKLVFSLGQIVSAVPPLVTNKHNLNTIEVSRTCTPCTFSTMAVPQHAIYMHSHSNLLVDDPY